MSWLKKLRSEPPPMVRVEDREIDDPGDAIEEALRRMDKAIQDHEEASAGLRRSMAGGTRYVEAAEEDDDDEDTD